MARTFLKAALIALLVPLGASGAHAQFGSIFGEPPRPPGSVPGGNQQFPQQQPARPLPPPTSLQPGAEQPPSPPPGPPGAVQSRPLPPPPGTAAVDPSQRSGQPSSQRQPRGPQQPADTSPQPGDEVIAEPPAQKIINPTALFSGLDKITGRIINFDVAIGETVQFGALQLTPRACYSRPPTETSNTDAFVEVDEVTLQGEVRRIFTGWMFASSPGLHAVEHPIYDLWLTDCKGGAQTVAAEKPADAPAQPPPAARPPQRAQPKRPPAQQQQNFPPFR